MVEAAGRMYQWESREEEEEPESGNGLKVEMARIANGMSMGQLEPKDFGVWYRNETPRQD